MKYTTTVLAGVPCYLVPRDELDALRKDAARYQFIRALENDAVAVQLVKSECDVELDDAIDAATRRAITRAAAAIGEGMI